MSYQSYLEMMGMSKGEFPPGVTTQHFNRNDSDNSWYGTIYYKDGVPTLIKYYIWTFSPKMNEELNAANPDYEMWDDQSYGNGHGAAAFRLKEKK